MTALHRWRWPIVLSVLAHIAAAAIFYAFADKLGQLPDVTRLAPDTHPRSAEEEQDGWVMDVGELAPPVAVMPSVEPPRPMVPSQSANDSAALASGGHKSPGDTIGEIKPAADATGGLTSPARPDGGATTTFFNVPTQAQSVVYVFDRSGSMGMAGRLAQARRELLASLERLPPTVRFQIIPFNRVAEPLRIAGRSDLVPATDGNKQQAALLLEGLVAEGGTEHLPALKQALLLQPEVIYFLTDADDLHPDQVRALTCLNHGRTTIHAIELTASHCDAPETPLHLLARQNGGQYRGVGVP